MILSPQAVHPVSGYRMLLRRFMPLPHRIPLPRRMPLPHRMLRPRRTCRTCRQLFKVLPHRSEAERKRCRERRGTRRRSSRQRSVRHSDGIRRMRHRSGTWRSRLRHRSGMKLWRSTRFPKPSSLHPEPYHLQKLALVLPLHHRPRTPHPKP